MFKVLNLLQTTPASLEAIFKNTNAEVASSLSINNPPDCAFVDTIDKANQCKMVKNVIYISSDEEAELLNDSLTSIIARDFTEHSFGLATIEKIITGQSSVNLDMAFKDKIDANHTLKITEPFSSGMYGDLIVDFAFRKGYDFVGVRNFVGATTSFFHHLYHAKLASYPIEVDYGVTKDSFILRFHATSEGLFLKHLRDSFKASDPENPFVGLLKICKEQSHALDICKIESSKRVSITGAWIKDFKGVRSICITNFKSFPFASKDSNGSAPSKIELSKKSQDLLDAPLKGGVVEHDEEKLETVEKVERPEKLEKVEKLERPEKLEKIEVKDDNINEMVKSTIESTIESTVEESEIVPSKQTDEQFKQVIAGEESDPSLSDDEVTTVLGDREKDDYAVEVVKALEDMDFEEVKKVLPGVTEKIDNQEKWEVKKNEMVGSLQKALKENKEVFSSKEKIDEQFKKIIKVHADTPNINYNEITAIVKSNRKAYEEEKRIVRDDSSLRKSLEEKDEKISDMKSTINQLHNKVSSFNLLKGRYQKTMSTIKEKMTRLENVEKEYLKLKSKRQKKSVQDFVKENMKNLRKENIKEGLMMEKQSSKNSEPFNKLEKKLTSTLEKLKLGQDKIKVMEKAKKDLEKRLNNTMKYLSSKEEIIKKLKKDKEGLTKSITELEIKNTELSVDFDIDGEVETRVKRALKKDEAQFKYFKEENTAKLREVEVNLSNKEQQIKNLYGKLDEAGKKLSDKKSEAHGFSLDNKRLQSKIDLLEQKIKKLEKKDKDKDKTAA